MTYGTDVLCCVTEDFIIRLLNDKEDFMWGMFFESTNPLKPQEINDDTLIVISEHDDIQLEINLNDLTKIKITVLK